MKNIFIAYFFIMFELSPEFGASSIELFPKWVGYLFLVRAFKELANKSETFKKNIMLTEAMVVVDGAVWLLDIFLPGTLTVIQTPMKFLLRLFYYSSTYNVMKGIKEIEEYHHADIGAKKINTAWWFFFGTKISGIIASVNVISLLIVSILHLVACIYHLVVLNKTRKAYEGLPQTVEKKSMRERAMIQSE